MNACVSNVPANIVLVAEKLMHLHMMMLKSFVVVCHSLTGEALDRPLDYMPLR